MKILILGSAFSGLCQRVLRELILMGHQVDQHYGMDEPVLRQQLALFQPELIICPFLTHRIPDDIWQSHRCLIVHPGIEGDRGASSLDWAIQTQSDEWGVTLLQADAEMDAGAIWGTTNFPLRSAAKTSVYKREVSSAAVNMIKKAVSDFADPSFQPRPLDYNNPAVRGRLLPTMKQQDRAINWQQDTSALIAAKINAADTTPGVLDELEGVPAHIFGAVLEPNLTGKPGDIIAIKHGAVCKATVDGAIWIRQAKTKAIAGLAPIKLPAEYLAKHIFSSHKISALNTAGQQGIYKDIWVEHQGTVAYVYFDFYNGAANTEQCQRLVACLKEVKAGPSKVVVLMGGENFFSNGIHLNTIEAAADPALESWLNINAIDDVVKEIIHSPNQVFLAALRNNAGAGGAIVALACDKIIGREGVVLNPHYQNMGLFGSEYWTYLLPKRVGGELAAAITHQCQPMLMAEALDIHLVDELFQEDWHSFHNQLERFAHSLAAPQVHAAILRHKIDSRQKDEAKKPLEDYRQEELAKMRAIFDNPNSYYHEARRNFVYKQPPKKPCWVDSSCIAKLELTHS
ncbi:MAG TPA: enoyl-CoA hydratase-related protein [Cellvibrionaceae bacterium]|nr:enoyl-CoA hydratase-related protein [Cellvibrionaceae bacterium]HMW71418.1 enoyl-CoA hydratase-related protein [Cellvibrionaceae bacterium]HMY37842.1 enoyl-CoA hydratase-related protein [Marinagarivorans sp.]HNG58290.1 enoyl-CoA hydratase-related protein [Cellvibrionaceae bacterium]